MLSNRILRKKVNGQDDITLATPADAFVSSTNGNAVGSEFEVIGWKDTLEPVLEFAGTPSVTRTLGGSVEMTQVGKEKRTVSSNIVNVRILTTKKE